MPGLCKNIRGITRFNHFTMTHHNHTFGIARNHWKIVADQQNGRATFPREIDQQLHNLALDNGIKRSGRLVRDQQIRLHEHRAGYHDALAHSA